jgi:hypothetical protein
MASIYDKALKRKDFSGIVEKEKEKEKEKVGDGVGGEEGMAGIDTNGTSSNLLLCSLEFWWMLMEGSFGGFIGKKRARDKKRKEEKDKKEKDKKRANEKADDPKAGADVGKIVNLMAGDANKVAHLIIL